MHAPHALILKVAMSFESNGGAADHRAKRPRPPLAPLTNSGEVSTTSGKVSTSSGKASASIATSSVAPACRCIRHARLARDWDEARWLSAPLGVSEMLGRDALSGAQRWHATLVGGDDGGSSLELGCFASAEAAAAAWDDEARRRGRRVLNRPRPGEVSVVEHLRATLAALPPDGALPPLPIDDTWRAEQFAELMRAAKDLTLLWVTPAAVQQADHCTAPGNQLIWSYQPHGWAVRKARSCTEGWQRAKPMPSTAEAFARPEFRARCVRALVELDGSDANGVTVPGQLDVPRLRQRACIFSGCWVLSFQPLVAAALLQRFGGIGGTVYDPCAGWGGRMLGAMAAGAVKYIGCEPATRTHAGLCALAREFAAARTGMACELHRSGCEDVAVAAESVDVALTSPPYFNLELYDDDPSQSHVRYPSPRWWEEQWLRRLFARVFAALKPRGRFLINVASNRMLRDGGCDLEQAACRCAKAAGFEAEAPLRMLKPTAAGAAAGVSAAAAAAAVPVEAGDDDEVSVCKFEPIFVFRKPARPAAAAVRTGGSERGCGPDESSSRLADLLDDL